MRAEERKAYFEKVKRIVVKVGSSSITHPTGKLNLNQIESLVRQLADLAHQGKEIILVSSGAVGAGMGKLGLKERPKTIPEKQAAAAVGQGVLLHMYEKIFAEYGPTVAQVLLTREDLSDRKRFLNARNALLTLISFGVIPIINENDTVAVDEIKFGDNDTLSAMVASLVEADLLIILSDIDGLYTGNPQKDAKAKLVPMVEEITPEVEALAGGAGSKLGTGGMLTKLQAGKIAMNSGVSMMIGKGQQPRILLDLVAGEDLGTWFIPKNSKLQCKKKWIAFGTAVQGTITVDAGAAKALSAGGKSLLASGITKIEGQFGQGNAVRVCDEAGQEIARGLVNYTSEEVDKIKGLHSKAFDEVLGQHDYDEVIHRDNLTISVC